MTNNNSSKFYLSSAGWLSAVLFCLPFSASFADHSWNDYHWARTANPFTLQVVDSVTEDWQLELDESLSRWSLPNDVINFVTVAADDSIRERKRCRIYKGQMHVCNADYGNNGWLGLATIGFDGQGHIDRGSAKVNDFYATSWAIPTMKNHVMCQEIGHVFGLGHTSEDRSSQGTCMDYSTNPDSEWPNQHDYEQLLAQYEHLNSYNSYAGAPAVGGEEPDSGVCNAPVGKGCNKNGNNGVVAEIPPMGIRVVKGKHHEIWVAPRADGGLWLHHIRLAPED